MVSSDSMMYWEFDGWGRRYWNSLLGSYFFAWFIYTDCKDFEDSTQKWTFWHVHQEETEQTRHLYSTVGLHWLRLGEGGKWGQDFIFPSFSKIFLSISSGPFLSFLGRWPKFDTSKTTTHYLAGNLKSS